METDVTIQSLAIELNISVDRLLYQFLDLGIYKTNLDYVTSQEKATLLVYMNCDQKKVTANKLTLQRKTISTLSVLSSCGKSKKVQVEVRKRRTYLKYDNNHEVSQNTEKGGESDSFVNFNDVSSRAVSKKRYNVLVHKQNLQTDLDTIDKTVDQDINRNTEELFMRKGGVFKSDNKDLVELKRLSKDFKCNQYEQKSFVRNSSYISTKKDHSSMISNASVVVLEEITNNSEGNNKKKVNVDRRFRGRQRLRSDKSRYRGKVNINLKYKKNSSFVDGIEYDDLHSVVRGGKNKQRKFSTLTHAFNKPTEAISRDVVIGEMVTVSELANKMAVKSSQVIKVMMELGAMVTINQIIDQQTAQLVAEEMGHRVTLRRESDLEETIMNSRDFFENSTSSVPEYRAPVVTFMGHVDHGKTSLLDCIRVSKTADYEEGGITQHIGVYCVEISNESNHSKKMITFFDTPGHQAFTAMRLRGVRMTDIVVLVVAVDDGVMRQTIEAIQQVKIAKIPMVVALNKIDKVDSFDIDRIKSDLAKEGVISEEWGGDTQFVTVSAKSKIGIDNLLNAILLESELLELKAVRKSMASGVVIESFLDKGRGPVARVLVREGTLKCGDVVLCGLEYGRIRSMRNEVGNNIIVAGPSMPAEIFGLSGPPLAGDMMLVVRDEKKAREVALYRQGKFRAVKLAQKKQDSLSRVLTSNVVENNVTLKFFNIILKADVQGSVEAIVDVLNSLSNNDVKVNIVDAGVGRISETDVSLAIATRSVLLGFNVQSDILSKKMIESSNLDVYYHSVIYDLIDDVNRLIDKILRVSNQGQKKSTAIVEVRDIFCFSKLGNVAGCMILEGIVRRCSKVRVLRKEKVVHEGELESLRRFKDDVNEVRAGMECGIVIKNYTDIRSGDFIEVFD